MYSFKINILFRIFFKIFRIYSPYLETVFKCGFKEVSSDNLLFWSSLCIMLPYLCIPGSGQPLVCSVGNTAWKHRWSEMSKMGNNSLRWIAAIWHNAGMSNAAEREYSVFKKITVNNHTVVLAKFDFWSSIYNIYILFCYVIKVALKICRYTEHWPWRGLS